MVQVLPADGTELVPSELRKGTLTSPGTDKRLMQKRA